MIWTKAIYTATCVDFACYMGKSLDLLLELELDSTAETELHRAQVSKLANRETDQ